MLVIEHANGRFEVDLSDRPPSDRPAGRLWQYVADHLAGVPVRVVVGPTDHPDLRGFSYKASDGSFEIITSDHLAGTDRLANVLHEVAHVRQGHLHPLPPVVARPRFTPVTTWPAPSADKRVKEREAERLAAGWLAMADRLAGTDADVDTKLRALAGWIRRGGGQRLMRVKVGGRIELVRF